MLKQRAVRSLTFAHDQDMPPIRSQGKMCITSVVQTDAAG